MKEPVRLSIDGMHCKACVRRVTEAIQRINGVRLDSVEVGSAQIALDPEENTAEHVIAAINGIGFRAHFEK